MQILGVETPILEEVSVGCRQLYRWIGHRYVPIARLSTVTMPLTEAVGRNLQRNYLG